MENSDHLVPILSIVTVCFSNPDELDATLRSTVGLSDRLIERVVVDGSSNSSCADIVESSGVCISSYLHEKDDGIYDAMNKGIRVARGLGILMLNSGDLLFDAQSFNAIVERLNSRIAEYVIFGQTVDDFLGKRVRRKQVDAVSPDDIRIGRLPSHQSIILPRLFCLRHPYDQNLKISADTKLLCQAFKDLPQLPVEEVFSVFRYGGRSNKALRLRDVTALYQEVVLARDLQKSERWLLYGRLLARWAAGSLIGEKRHRQLQWLRAAKRARAR